MEPIWQRLKVEQLVTQFVAWIPSLLAALLILIVDAALVKWPPVSLA